MRSPATAVSRVPAVQEGLRATPFPAAWGALRGMRAVLRRGCATGMFPFKSDRKIAVDDRLFLQTICKNFAVSPDRLCIVLFSNRSLIHWLSRYLLQIPALGMLWGQSRSLLHLLSCVLLRIQEFRALDTLQGTSLLAAGVCGQEGLVGEHSGVSDHVPQAIQLHIQQAAEQSSRSSFRLVSTHEQVSCTSCRGLEKWFVSPNTPKHICIHCKYSCLGVGRVGVCCSYFLGKEKVKEGGNVSISAC